MPTIVLPIGSWCYRVKVSYLRLVLSLSPRMKSSLNLFFRKRLALRKNYPILSQQLILLKVQMLNQEEAQG